MSDAGKIYLVGAGPGDPELLTLKAYRIINDADVVVYDRLVSQQVIDMIPAGASRIFVGKMPGRHHMVQNDINALLVNLAKSGHKVVRLKGGDPYVFGRGSEEALYSRKHGIPFEIVPGITSATACSAYAGIPLTHRGLANGVRFVTGHCQQDQPLQLNWQALADPDMTVVIYMGLANLEELSRNLVDHGLDRFTPVAIVERGTTPDQRRIITNLEKLVTTVHEKEVTSPALVIIGKVVDLADELDWFNSTEPEMTGYSLKL